MDKKTLISLATLAHEKAFSAYLRCECKARLTIKGCSHAQESLRTLKAYDAAVQS